MKNIISTIATIILLLILSWYMWQIGKLLSYKLMYKNMVRETITEMVNTECLKKAVNYDN